MQNDNIRKEILNAVENYIIIAGRHLNSYKHITYSYLKIPSKIQTITYVGRSYTYLTRHPHMKT